MKKNVLLLVLFIFCAYALNAQKSGKSRAGIILSIPTDSSIDKTKQKLPEIFRITPSVTPFISEVDKTSIIFKILNIKDEKEVQLRIGNGIVKIVPMKEIIPDGFRLSWDITLTEGKNEIEIIAKNISGENKQILNIEYKKPLAPPEISFISPQSKSSNTISNLLEVIAEIKNIKDVNKVNFKLNGKNQDIKPKAKNIDGVFRLTWNITLQEGQNEIELVAKNETKEENKKISINYKKPLGAPQITLDSPLPNSASKINTIQIVSTILNAKNSDIRLKQNNKVLTTLPKESSVLDGLKLIWDILLIEGQNDFEIVAKNETKEESYKFSVSHKPAKSPIITVISPKSKSVTTNLMEVTVDIINIIETGNVSIKFNNKTYESKPDEKKIDDGFRLTWNFTLTEGQNNFEIIAKNDDNLSVTEKLSVSYKQVLPPPEITRLNPVEKKSIKEISSIRILAEIKNIKSKNDITLSRSGNNEFKALNEEPITNGIKLTWQVNLNDGLNNFQILAKNDDVQTKDEFVIEYIKPLPPPEIKRISPSDILTKTNSSRFRVQAEITNISDEKDVTLTQNGKEFPITKIEKFLNGLKLLWQVDLMEGQNDFELIAFDNKGKTYTNNFRILYTSQTISDLLPKVWGVVVGITNYKDPIYNTLKYAASDAKLMYNWLSDIYGEKMIKENVSLLLDNEATRDNIMNALDDKIKLAGPNDLIIVYFACHGEVPTGRIICFICYDTDHTKVKSQSVTDHDIVESNLAGAQANKKILIADACHAGAVNSELADKRAINETNKLLLEMASKTGFPIFLASQANQYSQENQKWGGGHGVFTYFLEKGLRGEADDNEDGYVSVYEIRGYVQEMVRKETKSQQTPQMRGDSEDFYLSYKKK